MGNSSAGGDVPLQLHVLAADKILCNRLLSGLRRDGIRVSATIQTAVELTCFPDCDMLLLVDGNGTDAGRLIEKFQAEQPGVPLLVAGTDSQACKHAEHGCESVPVSDLPRLLRTLKHYLGLLRERKRNHRLARRLLTLESQHRKLLDQSPLSIALLAGGKHLYSNASYATLFGFHETGDLEQRSLTSLVAPSDKARLEKLFAGNADGACITITSAGETARPLKLVFTASIYKSRACLQVEASPARNRAGADSGTDLITRLDNLPRFTARLESAITAAIDDNIASLLLVARIDRFRQVQETIGKSATLQVLADIAGFLEHGISKPFTATRLAPDEFGILLFDSTAEEGARLADYISGKVNVSLLPPTADDIALGASLGLAVINQTAVDADDVIRRARLNTGNARKHGNAATQLLPRSRDTAEKIRQALKDDRMKLLFQPVVAFRPGAGACFEATFNLFDSDGSVMPVEGLFPCANIQSVATDIDRHVLRQVIATAGTAIFQVPLSSNSLASPDMLGWLSRQLRRQAFRDNRLQLLISEIDLHSNRTQVLEFCAGLDALGINRVLADFGSAVEPLPALAAIKPTGVRLDPQLVRDLPYSRQQQHKLGMLINAVHHQHVTVAATGLDDVTLLPLLWELGVDHVQGDCLQRPRGEAVYRFPEEEKITLPAGLVSGFGKIS